MNLCDSCKKFEGCPWTGIPQASPQRLITGFGACHQCDCHDPITRADLAAKDAEIEALRDEVRLTNEHEHAIMVELSTARDEIADLKRGRVVVPDDEFTLDLDTQKGSDPCITINSKKNGVGYELVRGSIDGHFSRRTYNITPYMHHCLDTIGIHPIPADRVLREGEARIGMNELQMLRGFAGRRMSEREYDRLEAVRDAHEEALRAQATTEKGEG